MGKTAWQRPSRQWRLAEVEADLDRRARMLTLRGRAGEVVYGFGVDPWAREVLTLVKQINEIPWAGATPAAAAPALIACGWCGTPHSGARCPHCGGPRRSK